MSLDRLGRYEELLKQVHFISVISNITYSNLISFLDELSIPVQCVVFIQRIAYDPVLYYVMV